MNRIEQLQQKHPWLSEEGPVGSATRYWTFTREMMGGDTLQAALDSCVRSTAVPKT